MAKVYKSLKEEVSTKIFCFVILPCLLLMLGTMVLYIFLFAQDVNNLTLVEILPGILFGYGVSYLYWFFIKTPFISNLIIGTTNDVAVVRFLQETKFLDPKKLLFDQLNFKTKYVSEEIKKLDIKLQNTTD